MSTQTKNTVFRVMTLAALISGSMVATAYAADAVARTADPSTLALFAIGLASLVATRKRVR